MFPGMFGITIAETARLDRRDVENDYKSPLESLSKLSDFDIYPELLSQNYGIRRRNIDEGQQELEQTRMAREYYVEKLYPKGKKTISQLTNNYGINQIDPIDPIINESPFFDITNDTPYTKPIVIPEEARNNDTPYTKPIVIPEEARNLVGGPPPITDKSNYTRYIRHLIDSSVIGAEHIKNTYSGLGNTEDPVPDVDEWTKQDALSRLEQAKANAQERVDYDKYMNMNKTKSPYKKYPFILDPTPLEEEQVNREYQETQDLKLEMLKREFSTGARNKAMQILVSRERESLKRQDLELQRHVNEDYGAEDLTIQPNDLLYGRQII